MTVITIALGLTMTGLSLFIRRSDAGSTTNLICSVHRTLSHQARLVSAGTAIYGFSMIYAAQANASDRGALASTDCFAYAIFPWWIEPKYPATSVASWAGGCDATRIGFKSEEDLYRVFGGSFAATNTVSTMSSSPPILFSNNYFFLFEDQERPWRTIYSTTAAARTTGTLSSGTTYYLHVVYEPGTGLMHATVNTSTLAGGATSISGGTLTGFPSTITLDPNVLRTRSPNQIELLMCRFRKAVNSDRIILYQNGSYEIKAAN